MIFMFKKCPQKTPWIKIQGACSDFAFLIETKQNQLALVLFLAFEPLIDFFFRFFFGATIALLNAAGQLVTLALNNSPVVIGQIAPFFFGRDFAIFSLSVMVEQEAL